MSAALSNTDASSPEFPALLMAGGRGTDSLKMSDLMAEVLREISRPQVVYIGTANDDNWPFFLMLKSQIIKAGASTVKMLKLARAKVDLTAARKALTAADVIFISGGEVEDGMVWLKRHGLVELLRELYAAGKPFIGVSAGTIMLGRYWVHWDVEGDDSTASLFDCLGISPLTYDTHSEGEDWVELKCALRLMGEGAQGFALPSGCAVRTTSQGDLVNLDPNHHYQVFQNDHGQIREL